MHRFDDIGLDGFGLLAIELFIEPRHTGRFIETNADDLVETGVGCGREVAQVGGVPSAHEAGDLDDYVSAVIDGFPAHPKHPKRTMIPVPIHPLVGEKRTVEFRRIRWSRPCFPAISDVATAALFPRIRLRGRDIPGICLVHDGFCANPRTVVATGGAMQARLRRPESGVRNTGSERFRRTRSEIERP